MSESIKLRNKKGTVYPYPYLPVGSIYMSIVDTNPSTYFGGTWEQLTDDTYLKVVTSNAGKKGGTSSDHKIPLESMPSHNHYIKSYRGSGQWAVGYLWSRASSDQGNIEGGQYDYTNSTGGGQPYYPYYYGIYAWVRTA